MPKVRIEVVPYGGGGDGPHRAGMAIVRLNGVVVEKLRTGDVYEIDVAHSVATRSEHVGEAGSRVD